MTLAECADLVTVVLYSFIFFVIILDLLIGIFRPKGSDREDNKNQFEENHND